MKTSGNKLWNKRRPLNLTILHRAVYQDIDFTPLQTNPQDYCDTLPLIIPISRNVDKNGLKENREKLWSGWMYFWRFQEVPPAWMQSDLPWSDHWLKENYDLESHTQMLLYQLDKDKSWRNGVFEWGFDFAFGCFDHHLVSSPIRNLLKLSRIVDTLRKKKTSLGSTLQSW